MKKSIRIAALLISAIMLMSALACANKLPRKYILDEEQVGLPSEVRQGWYKLSGGDIGSVKFISPELNMDKATYFQKTKDTVFRLTDDEFVFGDNTIKNPKYREIAFEGVIRSYANKDDWYRAIKPSEVGTVDADESSRTVKRCFVVTKADGTDTFFRIYLMDDEIWAAHFYERDDSLVCETIFIIAYDKIKNTISD